MEDNLIGKKINKLTVIKISDKRAYHGGIQYECVCECGRITLLRKCDLIKAKSCGCERHKGKHNLRNTREYEIWRDIKKRLYNPNRRDYPNYGGRGITMYEPWINDFQAFYDYLQTLPETREQFEARTGEKGSLDRIINDGNYVPGNLRWASKEEQAQNRRMCVLTEDIVKIILQEKSNGKSVLQIYNELLKNKIIECDFPPVEAAYYRLTWKNV